MNEQLQVDLADARRLVDAWALDYDEFMGGSRIAEALAALSELIADALAEKEAALAEARRERDALRIERGAVFAQRDAAEARGDALQADLAMMRAETREK